MLKAFCWFKICIMLFYQLLLCPRYGAQYCDEHVCLIFTIFSACYLCGTLCTLVLWMMSYLHIMGHMSLGYALSYVVLKAAAFPRGSFFACFCLGSPLLGLERSDSLGLIIFGLASMFPPRSCLCIDRRGLGLRH